MYCWKLRLRVLGIAVLTACIVAPGWWQPLSGHSDVLPGSDVVLCRDAFMTIMDSNGTPIEGSASKGDQTGLIEVCAVDHGVAVPIQDATGRPTGRRRHEPLTVTVPVDQATPELYKALTTNTQLGVTIRWYRINSEGFEEQSFTVTLTNAHVASISVLMPNTLGSASLVLTEPTIAMAFSYGQISWTWEPTGTEAEDTWTGRPK